MGVLMSLVTDSGEDVPIAYSSQADPKEFCRHVTKFANNDDSEIRVLLNQFNLDLEPLTRLSGEEFTLEAWMSPLNKITGDWDEWTKDMKLDAWNQHKAQIDASYQAPEYLIAAIGVFVESLEANPDVYKTVGIEDLYFINGSFLLHLKDLRLMAEWARDRGFDKVRLLVS